MAERTPLEQAKFDAAEMVNQAEANALAPQENVVLEVQNIKVELNSTLEGEE